MALFSGCYIPLGHPIGPQAPNGQKEALCEGALDIRFSMDGAFDMRFSSVPAKGKWCNWWMAFEVWEVCSALWFLDVWENQSYFISTVLMWIICKNTTHSHQKISSDTRHFYIPWNPGWLIGILAMGGELWQWSQQQGWLIRLTMVMTGWSYQYCDSDAYDWGHAMEQICQTTHSLICLVKTHLSSFRTLIRCKPAFDLFALRLFPVVKQWGRNLWALIMYFALSCRDDIF